MPELITSHMGNLQGVHVCELGPQIGNELLKGRRGGHGRQCVGRCRLQTTQFPSPRFHFATQRCHRGARHTILTAVVSAAVLVAATPDLQGNTEAAQVARYASAICAASAPAPAQFTGGNNTSAAPPLTVRATEAFASILRSAFFLRRSSSPVTLVACDRITSASHVCKIR
jgi:hypothetical protein